MECGLNMEDICGLLNAVARELELHSTRCSAVLHSARTPMDDSDTLCNR